MKPNRTTGAATSPRVTALAWGRMEAVGLTPGKDLALYPGGGGEWDWAEHGTRHDPGVQPGDVHGLLAQGAEVIVLSLGMERRLRIAPETVALLRETGVEWHAEPTRAAVDLYNVLAAGGLRVGGLFHSTC
ncbi:Mth938-like domain-containing protein [Streptomyces subrutilus]|uniref:Mth938-like domain-containing protein n=1 Tax=Streptomyces subrutilus TaxID=36818 RepID=UPI003406D20D